MIPSKRVCLTNFISAPSRLIMKSIAGIRDLDGEISIATVFPELISSPRSSRHDFSLLRTDETQSQAADGDSEDAYSVKSSANDGRRAPCAVAKSANLTQKC